MALKNIAAFKWEKILSKIDNPEAKRSVTMMRAKANEVSAKAVIYMKDPAPIPFDTYKSKLKFTSSAVDKLQAAYENKSLPTYHAALPSFEAKRREITLSVVSRIVNAAKSDLEDLTVSLQKFEENRMTRDTSVGELYQRFPNLAREVEKEIKEHKWFIVQPKE
jgi:hypothetical protein